MAVAIAATGALLVPAAPAGADEVVDTFTNGRNIGGWTWGFGNSIPDSGGNPGAYLRTEGLDTFAPQPRTTGESAFTGDYRAMEVTSVGVDLNTFAVDFSAGDRPLTLMLIDDNGTPRDGSDDTAAYLIGDENVPLPGEGWRSYTFEVPSQSMDLPAGWSLLQLGPGSPMDVGWNEIITDVDQVRFFYGDPKFFFIFQQWTLGLDNAMLCFAETGDTEPPMLECTAMPIDDGDDGNGGNGNGNTVTICHIPPGNPSNAHTINVGAPAVAAHLAHGDFLGPCDDGDGGGEPNLAITWTASDDSGEVSVDGSIDIGCETIAIENGQMIDLMCVNGGDDAPCSAALVDGVLVIVSSTAVFSATASDAAGNSTSCAIDLCDSIDGAHGGCAGDLDHDGTVGVGDLLSLLGGWGTSGERDLDRSGSVDAGDLAALMTGWGGCP